MEKRQLSLTPCTKQSCKPCGMGYILSNYVKPIMQCVTNDIKDYYMRLLTTKCLNTSVLLSYFMLGKRGIAIADQCDTHKVQERHKMGSENNTQLLDSLQKSILHKSCKYRKLYYILMTDTEFPHDDGKTRHFPGHVFLLEKIPVPGKEPTFYFHQSYINKYDYNGHIKRNKGTLERTYKEVQAMIAQIRYVLMNPTWDENTAKYWKDITFVDTKHMLGAHSIGKMFLCWRQAKVTDCIDHLETYTAKKLRGIAKLKMSQMHEVYGDKSAYDSDQNPLTVIEMKKSLEDLQRVITKTKSQLN